jgi:hypothetical protein
MNVNGLLKSMYFDRQNVSLLLPGEVSLKGFH